MISQKSLFVRSLGAVCALLAGLGAGCGVTTGKAIDRGPPPLIVLGETTPSGERETPPNANPFSRTCKPGEVLIGYKGAAEGPEPGQQLVTLQGFCATLSVDGTQSLRVNTAPSEALPVEGFGPVGIEQTQTCPSGEMVVAFTGRSGSDIDQLAIICAPIVIDGSYPNYRLSTGALDQLPPVGNAGGAPFGVYSCPPGQVAVGHEGRAATIINTVGLLCSMPMLVL